MKTPLDTGKISVIFKDKFFLPIYMKGFCDIKITRNSTAGTQSKHAFNANT